MPVTGSFGALRALQSRVDAAKIRGVLPKVAQRMGAAALKQLADEFKESRYPYGEPWKPLARRRARDKAGTKGKPLVNTGRMRGSASSQPSGTTVRVSIGTSYAGVHQDGAEIPPHSRIRPRELLHDPKTGRLVKKNTKRKLVYVTKVKSQTLAKGIKIPRRQMVPDRAGGLGDKWGQAFQREADAVLRKAIGK